MLPTNLFINSFTTTQLAVASDGVTPRMCCQILSRTESLRPSGGPGLDQRAGGWQRTPVEGTPALTHNNGISTSNVSFPGNLLVDVAYAGSKGTHLPYA